MKTKFIKKEIAYTGQQLKSHWTFEQFNLLGDVIVVFVGPAEVRKHLVDLKDVKAGAYIYSPKMLHFIIEHFGLSLSETVCRQRLLVAIAVEEINEQLGEIKVKRVGNDIYVNQKKLSVSIATVSPVSGLIHLGLNVICKNTPVPTIGLKDLGLPTEELAKKIMAIYNQEIKSLEEARCKVRAVQ